MIRRTDTLDTHTHTHHTDVMCISYHTERGSIDLFNMTNRPSRRHTLTPEQEPTVNVMMNNERRHDTDKEKEKTSYPDGRLFLFFPQPLSSVDGLSLLG